MNNCEHRMQRFKQDSRPLFFPATDTPWQGGPAPYRCTLGILFTSRFKASLVEESWTPTCFGVNLNIPHQSKSHWMKAWGNEFAQPSTSRSCPSRSRTRAGMGPWISSDDQQLVWAGELSPDGGSKIVWPPSILTAQLKHSRPLKSDPILIFIGMATPQLYMTWPLWSPSWFEQDGVRLINQDLLASMPSLNLIPM